jgi:hypothetical protein
MSEGKSVSFILKDHCKFQGIESRKPGRFGNPQTLRISSDLLPKWQLSGLSHEEPPNKTRDNHYHHHNDGVRLVDPG